MPNGPSSATPLTLVGRSSSHFTRVSRIFAEELGVAVCLRVVHDLTSTHPPDYGDNPALSVPSLVTSDGTWFGSLGACRELERRSPLGRSVLWPEALARPLTANAQELTLHAMSSEVALIMGSLGTATLGDVQREKLLGRLQGSLAWLDQNLPAVLALLPPRDLSYLEVTLFCLVTHLSFRGVLATEPFANLTRFSERFAERPSAQATPYLFDAPPAVPATK